MLKQRFVFAVSLFTILAVGNVWAHTASGDAVKTAHDVYTDLSTTETGIAGVSYVNKMVNAAGAAAQDAENHAASAGASALSAAAAASAAQTAANSAQTTANKVSNKFDNTSTVKNAIVTTDANGNVAPVAISDTGTGTYVTGVTVSGGTVTLSRGTPTAYSLPTASASTKGGVKIGANVNVATDGTISVTTTATPTQGSAVPLTSGGAYTALAAKEATANKLKTTDTTAVTDTNKDTLYPSVGKTQAMIDSKVAGLDKSDTAETGKYVSAVSETDGVITVSRASLPTVGNATLTIQRNGTTVDTFTANATTNKTINITDNDTTYTAGTNITISNGVISAKDTTYSTGTATASGLTKLYTTTGTATDGTMTQAALNTALSGKQATISDLSTIRSGAAAGATALQKADIVTGTGNGTISVDGTDVAVKGLGSAAYTASGAYATAAQGTKADAALPKATFDGMLSTSENGENGKIPTVGFMMDSIGDAQSEIGGAISAINTALAGKQATLTGTNVTSTGNGNVVTAVTASNGTVTVTKGTTLGSLATKSTVTSADITDGTIATADIKDAAVTVAKTTGLYGVIPSGSQGNTAATAFIWVE